MERAYARHDVDKVSDHEPIVLRLNIQARSVGFHEKVHSPYVSWG